MIDIDIDIYLFVRTRLNGLFSKQVEGASGAATWRGRATSAVLATAATEPGAGAGRGGTEAAVTQLQDQVAHGRISS